MINTDIVRSAMARLAMLLLLCFSTAHLYAATHCAELSSYDWSNPTNYKYRYGGDTYGSWSASSASIEPTSSMYFYSPYDYVMLTGGNKNTYPGSLSMTITPPKGVGTLTFLVAKPCISDSYCMASMYVYADGVAVASGYVSGTSTSYVQYSVKIEDDCNTLSIQVSNYYTNTTTSHNNRIAFAHFCWDDYVVAPPTYNNTDTTISYDVLTKTGYSWFGTTYKQEGMYSKTIRNTAGGDSIGTLILRTSYIDTISACYEETGTFNTPWKKVSFTKSTVDIEDCLYKQSNECLAYGKLHVDRFHAPGAVLLDTTICQDSSFLWHTYRDKTILSEGIHYDTLYSSAHCIDTVYTLKLHYKSCDCPPSYYLLDTTVTYDSLQLFPVQWFGQSLTVPGIYKDTLYAGNAFGCDSICRLTLRVTYTDTLSVCANDTAIFTTPWGMVTFPLTTVDSVACMLEQESQCVATASLHADYLPLTYHQLDTTVTYDSLQLFPIQWFGQSLTVPGIYNDTLYAGNLFGCDSIGRLTLRVTYTDTLSVCANDTAVFTTPWGVVTFPLTTTDSVACMLEQESQCLAVMSLHADRFHASGSVLLDTTVCEDISFKWRTYREQIITSEGTFYDTLYSSAHCIDTVYPLQLHYKTCVCPATYSDHYANIATEELPHVWRSYVIEEHDLDADRNATRVDIIPNAAGCDSVMTFHLHVREACELPTTTLPVQLKR